jgi:hypothetical protein
MTKLIVAKLHFDTILKLQDKHNNDFVYIMPSKNVSYIYIAKCLW